MRVRLLVAFWAGLLPLNVWAQEDAKREQEKLQGTWRFQKLEIPDGGPRKYLEEHGRMTISGNKATIAVMEKDQNMKLAELTFRLDPTRTPKALDLTWDFAYVPPGDKTAEAEWKKVKGKTIPAIYSFDGDTLRVFVGEDQKERPKEFPTKEGEGVIILKRAQR
jgi:uncharacterized protein (TIGR03067 family)